MDLHVKSIEMTCPEVHKIPTCEARKFFLKSIIHVIYIPIFQTHFYIWSTYMLNCFFKWPYIAVWIPYLLPLVQIFVKSILRQKSFKNPFSPYRNAQSREDFQNYGRSHSAPESYDHLTYR